MAKLISMIGQKFGKLTVVDVEDTRASNGELRYFCRCECGRTSSVRGSNLRNGKVRTCGCGNSRNHDDLRLCYDGTLDSIEPILAAFNADGFDVTVDFPREYDWCGGILISTSPRGYPQLVGSQFKVAPGMVVVKFQKELFVEERFSRQPRATIRRPASEVCHG